MAMQVGKYEENIAAAAKIVISANLFPIFIVNLQEKLIPDILLVKSGKEKTGRIRLSIKEKLNGASCLFSKETNMKSIFIDTIGLAMACIACAIVFCGLQCFMLSAHVYETIVGADS